MRQVHSQFIAYVKCECVCRATTFRFRLCYPDTNRPNSRGLPHCQKPLQRPNYCVVLPSDLGSSLFPQYCFLEARSPVCMTQLLGRACGDSAERTTYVQFILYKENWGFQSKFTVVLGRWDARYTSKLMTRTDETIKTHISCPRITGIADIHTSISVFTRSRIPSSTVYAGARTGTSTSIFPAHCIASWCKC